MNGWAVAATVRQSRVVQTSQGLDPKRLSARMAPRAVANPALGWRLHVEPEVTSRFEILNETGARRTLLDPAAAEPLPRQQQCILWSHRCTRGAKNVYSLAKWGETFLVGTPLEFFLQC